MNGYCDYYTTGGEQLTRGRVSDWNAIEQYNIEVPINRLLVITVSGVFLSN